MFMDTLFGTIKHPKPNALGLSHGLIPMPIHELEKSTTLTEAVLGGTKGNGVNDANRLLRSDAARGGASGENLNVNDAKAVATLAPAKARPSRPSSAIKAE